MNVIYFSQNRNHISRNRKCISPETNHISHIEIIYCHMESKCPQTQSTKALVHKQKCVSQNKRHAPNDDRISANRNYTSPYGNHISRNRKYLAKKNSYFASCIAKEKIYAHKHKLKNIVTSISGLHILLHKAYMSPDSLHILTHILRAAYIRKQETYLARKAPRPESKSDVPSTPSQ